MVHGTDKIARKSRKKEYHLEKVILYSVCFYSLLLSPTAKLILKYIVEGSVGIQLLVMMLWLAAVQGTDSTVGLLSFKEQPQSPFTLSVT